jgi:hypothetical protein
VLNAINRVHFRILQGSTYLELVDDRVRMRQQSPTLDRHMHFIGSLHLKLEGGNKHQHRGARAASKKQSGKQMGCW